MRSYLRRITKVKKYEKAISNQHSNNVQQNIQHPRAAELINYNPDELFIEPLTQGQILNEVVAMCRKENICIESNIDEIGGLAFYRKFTKLPR